MEIGSFEGASRDKEAISVTSALTLSITPIRRRGSIDGRSNSAGTETMTSLSQINAVSAGLVN
jgi:hypothetical protein